MSKKKKQKKRTKQAAKAAKAAAAATLPAAAAPAVPTTAAAPKQLTKRLDFRIAAQPNDSTCGPTCLAAVYDYYQDSARIADLNKEIRTLDTGGTLGVFLASHALKRGYAATIYTYNLQVFDPTWFLKGRKHLRARLLDQMAERDDPKLRLASRAYVEFLELGGKLVFQDLTPKLLRKFLDRGHPVLTGLSATYLYRAMREYGPNCDDDDVRGHPAGHFVVVYGYDREKKKVLVADPLLPNDYAGEEQYYEVDISRLVCSILLGIVTHDANMVIIKPRVTEEAPAPAPTTPAVTA